MMGVLKLAAFPFVGLGLFAYCLVFEPFLERRWPRCWGDCEKRIAASYYPRDSRVCPECLDAGAPPVSRYHQVLFLK